MPLGILNGKDEKESKIVISLLLRRCNAKVMELLENLP